MPSPGTEWIFISYRRKDSGGHARALYERLKADFGPDAVFFDNQHIDAGADFPLRLKTAMDAALVVVPVVGPDWLKEINKRAKKVAEVDFVRLELAQALVARPDGSARLIVPLLMAGADPIAAKLLAPAMRAEIGSLEHRNAVEFRDSTWDAAYKRLTEQIEPIRLARAGGTADHAAMSVSIAKALRVALARTEMQDIANGWDIHETNGVFALRPTDMLDDLGAVVKKVARRWHDDPSKAPAEAVRQGVALVCRESALEVLKLGVDPAAARAWVQSGASAPCSTVGMAGLIRAVATGEALVVDPVAGSFDFRPERHYELNSALDKGAAQKYRSQVARGLWPDAFAQPPVGDMNEDACGKLGIRIKRLSKRDHRSFVVTAPIKDPSYRSELNQLALPFHAFGLGRQPVETQNILRQPEAELVDAFCLCLEEIEKLA